MTREKQSSCRREIKFLYFQTSGRVKTKPDPQISFGFPSINITAGQFRVQNLSLNSNNPDKVADLERLITVFVCFKKFVKY